MFKSLVIWKTQLIFTYSLWQGITGVLWKLPLPSDDFLLAADTEGACSRWGRLWNTPRRRQGVRDGRTTHLQWLCLRTESLSTELHDRIGTKSVSDFVLTHGKKPQGGIGLQFWGRNQDRLVSWINAVKTQDSLIHAPADTSYGVLEHQVYQSTWWTTQCLRVLYRSCSLTWSLTLVFCYTFRVSDESRGTCPQYAPKLLIYSKCL